MPSVVCPHGRTSERAFTLIEMVVACVLLVVVVALVFSGVLQGFRASGDASSQAVAQQRVGDAAAAVRRDVRAAWSSDRDRQKIRDDVVLARALTDPNFVARSDDPADNGAVLRVEDVVVATPNRLSLRLNADPVDSGSECVELVASGAGGTFSIRRIVHAGLACSSAQVDDDFVLEPSRSIQGIVGGDVFRYVVLGPNCQTSNVANPVNTNRIIAVDVLLGASAQRVASVSADSRSSSVSLRSRETIEYRRALGCE